MADAAITLPLKPPEGSPCNGCGLCCMSEACPVAVQLLDAEKHQPCPALEYDSGRFWCGMIRRPEEYLSPILILFIRAQGEDPSAKFAKLIAVDIGCDTEAPAGLTALDAFRPGIGRP